VHVANIICRHAQPPSLARLKERCVLNELVGIGLYTPAEAARLSGVPSGKIARWLSGHRIGNRFYEPLWRSQVNLDDDKVYLGFRDLMEVRVANALMRHDISAIRVRAAIEMAREVYGMDRPLSTQRFKHNGRDIFLQVIERDVDGEEREALINTFRRQYEFTAIVEPSLKNIEFDDAGTPRLWWPRGKSAKIVVDPDRSFGQPIEVTSSVPTSILAAAGKALGPEAAARAYEVGISAVRRSMAFESEIRLAA
jgi:hypothetical protein